MKRAQYDIDLEQEAENEDERAAKGLETATMDMNQWPSLKLLNPTMLGSADLLGLSSGEDLQGEWSEHICLVSVRVIFPFLAPTKLNRKTAEVEECSCSNGAAQPCPPSPFVEEANRREEREMVWRIARTGAE